MKTIYYWLITSFVFGFISNGITQVFITNWTSHLGSPEEDYALASCVDHQNNVFTLGVFSDTALYADQQTVASNGRTDFFLTKHDPSGDLLWIKTFGGPEHDGADNVFFSVITFPCDIQIDQEGQIYIMGNHKGSGDFDPGPNEYLLSSTEFTNGFILKLNENGDFVFGQSYPYTYFQSMAISDSSIYLSGSFIQSVDFDLSDDVFVLNTPDTDGFILKLSNSGAYQSVVQLYSNESALVWDMAYDINDSSLYISGAFSGQFSFDTILITNGFSYFLSNDFLEGYMAKLDKNLNEIKWVKKIETTNNSIISNIYVLDADKLIISGDFRDSLTVFIDNQEFTYNSFGPNDSFLALINKQDGVIEKIMCFGNDELVYIQCLIFDQSNRIIFVSNVRQNPLEIEFNNFPVTIESDGIRSAFVIMMDTSFNYINHFSACAGDYIFDIYDLSIGLNNEINIAGTHSAPAYLCTNPDKVFTPFQGSYDAIGVQLVYDLTTEASQILPSKLPVVYPNPFEDYLHLDTNEEIISIQIVDLLGQNVSFSKTSSKDIILNKFLTPGLYSIQIETTNSVYHAKIIKK